MPSGADDEQQFEDAVKPALESLLADLQKTTEVLRQGHGKGRLQRKEDETAAALDLRKLRNSPRQRNQSPAAAAAVNLGGEELQPRRDPMLEGDKLGIHTIPKGDCASCNQAVIGPVVIALGKMWHPEHFCCAHCGDSIENRNFFERQGKAYCEGDYHDLFSPRCSYCNGPIKERCVTALGGKTFHVEHFVCAECGKAFGEGGFHEKSNLAYCRDCFYRTYAPKCQSCKQPITHKFITALNTHWHPECFCCQVSRTDNRCFALLFASLIDRCFSALNPFSHCAVNLPFALPPLVPTEPPIPTIGQECGQPFHRVSLFDHMGRLLCEMCLHTRAGSICARCRLPISGRCVSAMSQKFHPEHFTCSYCADQLDKGTFKECAGRPFCLRCYQTVCR